MEKHGCVPLQEGREANGQPAIAPLSALADVLRLVTPRQELLVPVRNVTVLQRNACVINVPIEVRYNVVHSLRRIAQYSLLRVFSPFVYQR